MPDASTASTSQSSPDDDFVTTLNVSHGGRTERVGVSTLTSVDELSTTLTRLFQVDRHHQKLLLPKGVKFDLQQGDERVIDVLKTSLESKRATTSSLSSSKAMPAQVKVMLIGPTMSSLDKLETVERGRDQKRQAFEFHQRHKSLATITPSNRIRTIGDEDDVDKYKFHEIKPFGQDVECFQQRQAMLDRLVKDEAVRHVMQRHKFVVGVLTELHPLLQPTILGLNKNAGQEISLRLLTDDLTGTRSYLDVRKVLLHELSHNRFGPHDDDFKTLNSLLNRQVIEYETQHGITTSSGPTKPWEPTGADSQLVPRGGRTLNDSDDNMTNNGRDDFEWTEEELVDMRREKMRMAAEARLDKQRRQ
ncbi:hypothetical protein OIO90_002048 [Microbotryomycetes sp. JL221]|nr:hypothetical protein OIO90_002048 [Microbotryomycetes sp. JL221]